MSKLYLLPNLLGDYPHHEVFLPASVDKAMANLDGLIAESEKEGRRYLGRFTLKKEAREIPIAILDKNTPDSDLDFLLEPIKKGETWGYVSDAGIPCIADPGSKLVHRARKVGINIQAFVGPSAIFLALMLSGFPSQKFQFHGYLPKDREKRITRIKEIESHSKTDLSTEVLIEAPHRNKHMLEDLIAELDERTELCVAWDLSLPTQGVLAAPVASWKKMPMPNIEKKPATFLIYANRL